MSDLYDFIKDTGVIVADTSTISDEVKNEWKAIFGNNLSMEEGTPQGRIMELLTKERKTLRGTIALIANQINPDVSSGVFLDAIGLLFGVERRAATHTLVQNVNMYGLPPTTATGTITFENNNLIAGDTVSIGDDTYTFGSGEGNVAIAGSATATASNLASAINANANSTVSAVANNGVITLTANDVQAYGNTDALDAETQISNVISLSGDMLDGGTVIIPDGTLAADTSDNQYYLSGEVRLEADSMGRGVGLGNFIAVESGAISCPPNTLTNCTIQQIDGWESVNNASAGIMGYEEESDASYRISINRKRSKYASSYLSSLYSALYELEGTQSVYIYENPTGETKTNEQDPIVPIGEDISGHSIFIVVAGDTNNNEYLNQVAKAIVEKRSGGCGMVASSAYPDNVKQISVQNGLGVYTMTFNVAEPVPISTNIVVKNISFTGDNLAKAVQQVISDWFAGNIETTNKNEVGYDISSFDIASIVSQQLGVYVQSCEIKKTNGGDAYSTAEIPIDINEIATFGEANVGIL